jgi:hypothetical protein
MRIQDGKIRIRDKNPGTATRGVLNFSPISIIGENILTIGKNFLCAIEMLSYRYRFLDCCLSASVPGSFNNRWCDVSDELDQIFCGSLAKGFTAWDIKMLSGKYHSQKYL